MDHVAVSRCASLKTYQLGYLCSCGRTILGSRRVDAHFVGRPMSKEVIEQRLEEARLLWAMGTVFSEDAYKQAVGILLGEAHG